MIDYIFGGLYLLFTFLVIVDVIRDPPQSFSRVGTVTRQVFMILFWPFLLLVDIYRAIKREIQSDD